MSNDSSSSEEELEKYKESVDENFLPKKLYKNGSLEEKNGALLKPSLRNQNHETTSANPYSIKVTPEFQKYVAEHLSRLLDELIDDTDITLKKKKPEKKHRNSGIKLFHSSKNYLILTGGQNADINSGSTYKKRYFDAIDYEKRAREVAVSPEWVLSKQEIKYWAPETKGEIEVVKLDSTCNKSKYRGRHKF